MSSYQKSVSLDAVIVDQRVQRTEGPDQRRVDKMASMFNPDALGVLILSEREDGTLVCLDGMHRCLSARKAGHTALMEAKVFTGLTLAEEASLFLLYNDKKDPSAVSKFNTRVVAEDPVAQDIDRIIRSHGWRVATSTHPGCINAINKAEDVYRTGAGSVANGVHPEILDRVLSIITAAWGHDQHGVHQAILAGMGQVIGRFGTKVDSDKMIAEIRGTRPETIIGSARSMAGVQRTSVSAALARDLARMHDNRRRKNLLPISELPR
jgi:hypothetical protein